MNEQTKTEWTTAEIAKTAGTSDAYIRQELIAKRIRGRKIGHIWVVSNGEALRWLESRRK